MNTGNKEITTEDVDNLEGLLRDYGYSNPECTIDTVMDIIELKLAIPSRYNVFIGIRQMVIKGYITTEELQQVGGCIPKTFAAMRQVCGVTEGKFKGLLVEGKVTTQLVLAPFLEELW